MGASMMYGRSDGEREEPVPRHTEVNEKLATAILNRGRKKV